MLMSLRHGKIFIIFVMGGLNIKVFVLESSSPLDLMSGVSESKALEEICKMMQHSVTSFFVKSSNEFDTAINYIATIDDYVDDEDEEEQICIHISCHGNNDGLALGKDFLMWEEVANSLLPLLKLQRLKKPIYLAISACGTDNQKISSAIRKIFNKEKI